MPSQETIVKIIKAQENEITEYHIYQAIAKTVSESHNKNTLKRIAADELSHYKLLKSISGIEVRPNRRKIIFFVILAKIFGFTFAIKRLEKGEGTAQVNYAMLVDEVPDIEQIIRDEDRHEKELIDILDEKRLWYIGSVVLGMSDAIVEMLGALAGLTFALQNTQLIALTATITGIAASLSMGSSEYIATKTENDEKHPVLAGLTTGTAFVVTVFALIMPFYFLTDYYLALGISVVTTLVIIAIFTFYISVAKEVPFKKRFLEMSIMSLGVAGISFGIGLVVKQFLDIDI
ncbi:MAG: VIT1/CCC1 transporter family protein [Fibrobacterales bacterium]